MGARLKLGQEVVARFFIRGKKWTEMKFKIPKFYLNAQFLRSMAQLVGTKNITVNRRW
jgi:hypothetical protein